MHRFSGTESLLLAQIVSVQLLKKSPAMDRKRPRLGIFIISYHSEGIPT